MTPGARPGSAVPTPAHGGGTELLLRALRLTPGQRFLDAACGAGDAFFPLFEALGGKGVFLAAELEEDVLRRFLARLEGYAEHPGYARIEVVRMKPERLPLPDRCADRILLAGRLHAAADRVALLDWRHPDELHGVPESPLAPPPARRLRETQACDDLLQAGYRLVVSHAGFGPQWCLTAAV